nr:MAG TPA: distal tail protein [Caudoviricetes sp.]
MNQTIKLDTRKREGKYGEARVAPLRRGERNNVTLTVAVRRDRRPYGLTGMTVHLVWRDADGKLVGPVPMEVADQAAGTVRCILPDACYSAVGTARAYVELRRGDELVDTTDEMLVKVLDCIDADAEQAEEYKPLIAEVREATDAAIKAATDAQAAIADAQAAIAEVKATEAKLYPVAENILVGSETGAVAHVEDAFAGAALRRITVEGAYRQDGIPSPDAPKPITVVENPTVKVTGRNLWPFASSCTSIKGHQNEFVREGTPFTLFPGAYTFSATGSLGDADAPLFGYTATGRRFQLFRILHNVTNPKYSFTVTEPITSVYFVSNAAGSSTGTISNIQLERNSEATEYKPYTSQTLTFTLPAEHPYLAKLPDGTADEIRVDRDGNVELVARVSKVIPKDVDRLNFGAGTDTDVSYVLFPVRGISSKMGILCNSYQTSNWTNKSGYIYCPNGLDIAIRDDRFESKKQAIELLNGVVVYIAVEPTRYSIGKIEMPKAQDSIVNARTDAEVTPNTSISYVRDVNIVVANIEKAIASIAQG